jgi:hypothetical protein
MSKIVWQVNIICGQPLSGQLLNYKFKIYYHVRYHSKRLAISGITLCL